MELTSRLPLPAPPPCPSPALLRQMTTYYSEKIQHAETPKVKLNDGRSIPIIGTSLSRLALGRDMWDGRE